MEQKITVFNNYEVLLRESIREVRMEKTGQEIGVRALIMYLYSGHNHKCSLKRHIALFIWS